MHHGSVERPNVIVVLTDQQRWDSTGVAGNPLDLTPNFDEFAATGTCLSQAFTAQPVCGPARAAIQTGRYPTSSGCFRNGLALPQESETLATYFDRAGYATGYVGKWHLAGSDPVPAEYRGGYRSWLGANVPEFTSDAYHTVLFDDDGDAVFLPGYRSDALFDAAIRFVADHAGPPASEVRRRARPFYLFCSLVEPHHQNEIDAYPAPTVYARRYQGRWTPPDLAELSNNGTSVHRHLAGYWGQIRRVDEGFGRLLDALRSMELLSNTIVVFTSDHGCHFKTRDAEYKRSCHDASIRVPMAVGGPGFEGGRRVERPVSTIDLLPTLLDAASIGVPDDLHGRSVLPLVRDPSACWRDDVFVQVSESEVGRTLRTSRWKYHVTAPGADPWHDAGAAHYVEAELYDLAHDPHELTNLAGSPSHQDVSAELRERLRTRMAEAGEEPPEITPSTPMSAPDPQRRVDPMVHTAGWRPERFGHQPKRIAGVD